MFKASVYDKKQLANLKKRIKIVQALFDEMAKKSAQLASKTGYTGDAENDLFEFKNYPKLKAQVEQMLQDFASGISSNLEQGNKQAWHIANAKNDAMIANFVAYFRKRGRTISNEEIQSWKQRNLDSLEAFQNRKIGGMGLSERVWKMTNEAKEHIEMSLDLGLSQGKSAQALSRDVRNDLKNPHNLFRRVRGADGKLRLSKRAQALSGTFGQGVYRSSYKNALRMTATETNMAYRSADYENWQNQRYVLGIKISLSNNHPEEDICDTMAGKVFPKTFKFTGWHPWCRCFATAVQPTEEEMDKMADMTEAEEQAYLQKKQVKTMPKEFTKWIDDNAERIANAKNIPYFIKDNYVDGDISKGFKWEQKGKPTATSKPATTNNTKTANKPIKSAKVGDVKSTAKDYSAPDYMRPSVKSKISKSIIKEDEFGVERISEKDATRIVKSVITKGTKNNIKDVVIEDMDKGFAHWDWETNTLRISSQLLATDEGMYGASQALQNMLTRIKRGDMNWTKGEEYSLEIVQHEVQHSKTKGWIDKMKASKTQEYAVETINQFVARKSYHKLMSEFDLKPKFADEILESGYGVNNGVTNLRSIFKAYRIDENKAYKDLSSILFNTKCDYIEDRLISYLTKRGVKNARYLVTGLNSNTTEFVKTLMGGKTS